jgi:hypothetical protein
MNIAKALPGRRGWRHPVSAGAAVIIAAAITAGALIGSQTSHAATLSSAEPPLGAVPVVDSQAMVSYPLDSYGPTDAQMSLIMQARRIFEIRCMQSLGFHGSNFADLLSTGFNETAKGQLITFLNPATAARYGYHSPQDVAAPAVTTAPLPSARLIAKENFQAAVIDGHVKTVNGHTVPAGGCRAEGLRLLEAGTSGNLAIDPRYLMGQSEIEAITDPRLRQAIARWSSCMKASGYDFSSPFAAESATAGTRQQDGYFHTSPTPLERRTAVADAACRMKVNLTGIWVAVESAYQNKMIASNRAKLDQARTTIAIWLRNARAAVTTAR